MKPTGNLAGVEFIAPPMYHHARQEWEEIISNSGYFFTKGAMRFFSSRVLWDTLTKIDGETFGFVTSEKCEMPYEPEQDRRYTVRVWISDRGLVGGSEFQEFATAAEAREFLMRGGIIERMAS